MKKVTIIFWELLAHTVMAILLTIIVTIEVVANVIKYLKGGEQHG